MLKCKVKEFTFFILIFLTVSCTKYPSEDPVLAPVTGGRNSTTPLLKYKIGNNSAVRVDCSEISFEAGLYQMISGVVASSISVKSSIYFVFKAKSAEISKLIPGNYPIKAYYGTIHKEIFHLSLRAPNTLDVTYYYLSLDGTGTTFKNEVKSIKSLCRIENRLV